jgi:hypothetical protein
VLGSYGVVDDVFVVSVDLDVLGVDAAEFVPEHLGWRGPLQKGLSRFLPCF